ncbi:hypothetical protein [Cupriavidus agavae]|uniref:Uncharacterized protein n=1 Tax=Cupriavidus agavae TaxID=1001822 RepID=A0A4Q7RZX9_9BURK|nr:hypothetical protein [Cupriavidus agavae]RZT39415.1 hypothetical protein EV147_2610 [Cupriavidus agavae]
MRDSRQTAPSMRRPVVAALAALMLAQPALALTPAPSAPPGPFAAAPAVQAPQWVGVKRWSMRMAGHKGDPFRLRLGFTALPSGDWAITGSLVLDDAELGATGSARLREGKLIADVLVSAGVRNVPPDDEKRALFPKGKVPATISSAGFAAMRLELDPRTLDGVASMYMTNVVSGNLVQGPYHADSTLTLDK